MQDRFKFRSWDKAIREMIYNIRFGFIKDSCIAPDFVWADTSCGQKTYREDRLKDIELMQCTGLKDKNGKLIFECDIVKDDHEALHQVKWCYNCFLLKPCFKNGYTLGIVDDEIEIIGNIYENPELIGGAEC